MKVDTTGPLRTLTSIDRITLVVVVLTIVGCHGQANSTQGRGGGERAAASTALDASCAARGRADRPRVPFG